MTAFKYRGPNTFHFARRRHKLPSLRSKLTERLVCIFGGGHWSGKTGDGEAWRPATRTTMRVRSIKSGRWVGPWRYEEPDAA